MMTENKQGNFNAHKTPFNILEKNRLPISIKSIVTGLFYSIVFAGPGTYVLLKTWTFLTSFHTVEYSKSSPFCNIYLF